MYRFRFTDRREESGITFRHHIVDDAGKHFIPVHYDHGNGLAVADVGGNELWRNLGGGRFKNITASAGVAVAD